MNHEDEAIVEYFRCLYLGLCPITIQAWGSIEDRARGFEPRRAPDRFCSHRQRWSQGSQSLEVPGVVWLHRSAETIAGHSAGGESLAQAEVSGWLPRRAISQNDPDLLRKRNGWRGMPACR